VQSSAGFVRTYCATKAGGAYDGDITSKLPTKWCIIVSTCHDDQLLIIITAMIAFRMGTSVAGAALGLCSSPVCWELACLLSLLADATNALRTQKLMLCPPQGTNLGEDALPAVSPALRFELV
jgi:hypothetical protein